MLDKLLINGVMGREVEAGEPWRRGRSEKDNDNYHRSSIPFKF